MELGQVIGKANIKKELLPFFLKCIQDNEAEVKNLWTYNYKTYILIN